MTLQVVQTGNHMYTDTYLELVLMRVDLILTMEVSLTQVHQTGYVVDYKIIVICDC